MILAVDVHYSERGATAAGVLFNEWGDVTPTKKYVSHFGKAADYRPGEFYLRELPPIMGLIEENSLRPDFVVVDGFVYLDGRSRPGMGKRLYDALGGETAVIGVAKGCFRGIGEDYAVRRGTSKRPLYVTAAGVSLERAKECILMMHGSHRLPTILKLADTLSRSRQPS